MINKTENIDLHDWDENNKTVEAVADILMTASCTNDTGTPLSSVALFWLGNALADCHAFNAKFHDAYLAKRRDRLNGGAS